MTAVRATVAVASLLLAAQARAQPASPAPPGARPDAATAPAPAADPAAPGGDRVGLGAGIGSGGSTILLVPIDAGATRIELEVAYHKDVASDLDVSTSHLGLGALGLWSAAPAVRGSAGARIQWERASSGSTGADAFRVAAVLGAEWVPVPAVSLGVEGQAGYAFASDNATTGGFDVSAQAVLRVFLSSSGAKGSGASAGAATPRPAAPPRKRCSRDSECDGLDVCFDGVCRH